MAFEIIYSPEALDHLRCLSKRGQVTVLDQVDIQLSQQPKAVSHKRKLLRPNTLAPWELRLGDLRVFCEVQDEPAPVVTIKAVGVKRHNQLKIGDEEITL